MSDAGVGQEDGASGPRWWTVRRAQSSKPATYRCPFCDARLHAMSEHMLIAPEGDVEQRRHAHTECVRAAHEAGDLVTEDEWRALQPNRPGLVARLLRHVRGPAG
jgi:hypothetical protein